MKVAIIEDEAPAAEKLERYLHKYDVQMEVLAVLPTVKKAVEWLASGANELDLMFADVQLTDGLSFEIFSQVSIQVPVIFTTAFDEFAVDAFKVNSMAYLLKPITFTDLSAALKKVEQVKSHFAGQPLTDVAARLAERQFKDRFMVKVGTHIQSVKTEEVVMFHAEGRTVYLTTSEGRRFIIDYKLEDLDALLHPKVFFRANRTYILNINKVADVVVYSNSRLNVKMTPSFESDIVVSRERVAAFKEWLEGG